MTADASTNPFEALFMPFASFLRTWNYQPVTSWFDNFITINANTKDAAVEQHVLGEVGSYGYQINRLLDAVNLLVGRLELSTLSAEDQRIVVRVADLADKADRAAKQFHGGPKQPDPTPSP